MITITINWKCENCGRVSSYEMGRDFSTNIRIFPQEDGWGYVSLFEEDQKLLCPECYNDQSI